MGFLLRSLNVSVALTSEVCHKTLPREPTGEIGNIKGWPKLMWFCTENFTSKPPKDWHPPADIPDHAPAYIEVSILIQMKLIIHFCQLWLSLSVWQKSGGWTIIVIVLITCAKIHCL